MIYDIEINSAAHYPAVEVVGLVERAEQAGFDAFWKGESNSTDPMVLISAAAGRTSTIKLGTAIYHIYGRSPVTLGLQAATLQDLSGGRVLLGLGVANKAIAAWHGGVFDRPLRRVREYIEIVRKVVEREMPDKAPIDIVTTPSNDLRSYHVSSRKIADRLGYLPKRSIEDAVADLCAAFREGKLPNSLTDDRYFNVKTVKKVDLK